MSNTPILVPNVIAKEALMQLRNKLIFGRLAHRQFKKEFAKVGDTVTIRKPVKLVTVDGANRVNQDIEEGSASIKIDQRKHVSWKFSTQDLIATAPSGALSPVWFRFLTELLAALADLDARITALEKK